METALQGKRFQDAEDLEGNVMAQLNAAALMAFADCFKRMFKDSTRVFKWVAIN
jgi:hypothetical protein